MFKKYIQKLVPAVLLTLLVFSLGLDRLVET